jgi:hypothetical protein
MPRPVVTAMVLMRCFPEPEKPLPAGCEQRTHAAFHARYNSVPFRTSKWNSKRAGRRLSRLRNTGPPAADILARALHPVSLEEGLT